MHADDPEACVVVTGGCGFIGSCVVRRWLETTAWRLVCVDKLTYAGNLASLGAGLHSPRLRFERLDIGDAAAMHKVFADAQPDAVVHLAAESHVDRSIHGPRDFIDSNIVGTYTLLQAARAYWEALPAPRRERFRFLHVSTDEVFGSLDGAGGFIEASPYAPNSPYAASKAAADHLARAWNRTYGLPLVISNCSNNYGPYQFPEKLIPLVVLNALAGKPLPVYGDGGNVRDWLFVEDHVDALRLLLQRGRCGHSYNVGGGAERRNLELVQQVCGILDELRPQAAPYRQLIRFVEDRPGHDRRYAIDSGKIAAELGWQPRESLASGLRRTVQWYLDNEAWVRAVTSGAYREWLSLNYDGRGGAGEGVA